MKSLEDMIDQLRKIQETLEIADKEYMTDDVAQSDFAEDLMDTLETILPFKRCKK